MERGNMTAFGDLLSSMEQAGLWAGLGGDAREAVKQALAAGEDSTWTAGGAWRADGEDLADGEVERWLSAMSGSLLECGVDLRVSTVDGPFDVDSPGYSVAVNESELNLYRFEPTDPGVPASADPWLDCTVVPLAAVNRLLANARSPRRLSVFWPGGNDGFAVLGDEGVLRRAAETSRISDFRIP
jgi:hypothetical protein